MNSEEENNKVNNDVFLITYEEHRNYKKYYVDRQEKIISNDSNILELEEDQVETLNRIVNFAFEESDKKKENEKKNKNTGSNDDGVKLIKFTNPYSDEDISTDNDELNSLLAIRIDTPCHFMIQKINEEEDREVIVDNTYTSFELLNDWMEEVNAGLLL